MKIAIDAIAPASNVKYCTHANLNLLVLAVQHQSSIQVAIADVDRDGQLELLLADSSGTVACVRHDGTECWSTRLEGTQRARRKEREDRPILRDVFFAWAGACVRRELSPCLRLRV